MLTKLFAAVVGVALLTLPVASCGDDDGTGPGPGPVTVNVSLGEFSVDLGTTTLPLDEPITFVVKNDGAIPHEFLIEGEADGDEPLEADGREAEIEEEDLPPGATATLVWTFTDAGTFLASCHVPGHFEAGMRQSFRVQ